VQHRRIEVDREVVAALFPPNLEHTAFLKGLKEAPDLPLGASESARDVFGGAVRAEGDVEEHVALGRQKRPVDNRRGYRVGPTDATVFSVGYGFAATAVRKDLFRPGLRFGLRGVARANPLGVLVPNGPTTRGVVDDVSLVRYGWFPSWIENSVWWRLTAFLGGYCDHAQ
jgi:hypothetical protein